MTASSTTRTAKWPGSRRPRRRYRPGSRATATCVANGAGDWWEESVRPVGTATSCRESKKVV
ncbi:hypothetical protein [Pseudomonas phage vB_Pa-PAC7]